MTTAGPVHGLLTCPCGHTGRSLICLCGAILPATPPAATPDPGGPPAAIPTPRRPAARVLAT